MRRTSEPITVHAHDDVTLAHWGGLRPTPKGASVSRLMYQPGGQRLSTGASRLSTAQHLLSGSVGETSQWSTPMTRTSRFSILQLQEAKNRLSDVIQAAQRYGPQTTTRRGEPVAVIMPIATGGPSPGASAWDLLREVLNARLGGPPAVVPRIIDAPDVAPVTDQSDAWPHAARCRRLRTPAPTPTLLESDVDALLHAGRRKAGGRSPRRIPNQWPGVWCSHGAAGRHGRGMHVSGSRAQAALIDETDRKRMIASSDLDQDRRAQMGQYLTPGATARLMAGWLGPLPDEVHLLDAGAGAGSLTAAVVAQASQRSKRPSRIVATAFECDDVLLPHLRATMRRCATICTAAGIAFTSDIHHGDFITAAVQGLERRQPAHGAHRFHAAILNPPYCKMGAASRERRLLQRVGLDATNLYAAFVALAIRLLKDGGQLVAIIPRSCCNGPYFRPFRAQLLDETAIRRIHVFDARNRAFSDDGVLQENIIVHAVKGARSPAQILVSHSASADGPITVRKLPIAEVVRCANGDRFVHLPIADTDNAVSTWMQGLPDTLESLGITVSTGRVVDFRARDHLHAQSSPGRLPLIHPFHFAAGMIRWPRADARKPNAIAWHADTRALFIPRGYYTLAKRFSSKEERRRLVAAVYDPGVVAGRMVGLENHLNYFHASGQGLEPEIAYGLMAYLNATPVDQYLRQFNGHTQVNATDLRSLRFPSQAQLRRLGRAMRALTDRSQEVVDRLLAAACPLPR